VGNGVSQGFTIPGSGYFAVSIARDCLPLLPEVAELFLGTINNKEAAYPVLLLAVILFYFSASKQ